MEFVVKLVPDDGSYMVTCAEVPEFLSTGDTPEAALKDAVDGLETALMIYVADRRPIPTPRRARKGELTVALPAQAVVKAMLHNELLSQGVKKAELACRLGGLSGSQVERLFDMKHATKLASLEAAAQAMGKRLTLHMA